MMGAATVCFKWETFWPHAASDIRAVRSTSDRDKVTCDACLRAFGSQLHEPPVDPHPCQRRPHYGDPCDCEARLAQVVTHTRTSTPLGPDFCAECSEAISEWVPWPCERRPSRVLRGVTTMTLAEFLLARIAEDEAMARAADDLEAIDLFWSDNEPGGEVTISRARLLAECEAKRQIVERWHRTEFVGELAPGDQGTLRELALVLGILALPYASHPDFREAWRP